MRHDVMYEIRDVTMNNNFKETENLYNQLMEYKEFSEYLPNIYTPSVKFFIGSMVNTCTHMAFETALMDLDLKCKELASNLRNHEDPDEHKISEDNISD